MPPFGLSSGLDALTSWLSGSSKPEKDGVSSSTKTVENTTPAAVEKTTTWNEMIGGKTFEQAMAAVMAAMPPLPHGSGEADELADALQATTLSENASSKAKTDGGSNMEQENAEELVVVDATLQDSSDLESRCHDDKTLLRKEDAVKEIMRTDLSLEPGSTEYFDAIAHVYNDGPSQVAYGSFLKGLIKKLKDQNWIALDPEKEGGVKVVDYGAGTGLLSHALAPYATEILAIDKSAKMVEEYNKIVAKENNTKCDMKAVRGDMTTHLLTGKRLGIEEPEGVSAGFDVVAMCLAVDFFTHEDIDDDAKHEQLVRALDVMINLLEANGTLLIIDVEKCVEDSYADDAEPHTSGSPHEGLKVTGHGSNDIVKALEELGMEDVAVISDERFRSEVECGSEPTSPGLGGKETYFAVKAERGSMFEKRLDQRIDASSDVEWSHRGGE